MASPGDKKGQRRGSCGHVMALFDLHDKCARCREKLIGEDNCVKDKPCKICDGFTPAQKDMLSTPIYKIRRDKKAGLLVSPKEVTVLQPVESMDSEPTFQSPSGQQAQSSANPPSTPPSSSQQTASFVTSDQLTAIADKWSEQFARMEALLSRGNVFSTPISSVKPVDSQNFISDNPFLAPATRPTGPVKVPVAVEAPLAATLVDAKDKKKSHKSRKDKHSDKSDSKSSSKSKSSKDVSKPEKRRDRSPSPVSRSKAKAPSSSSPLPGASSGPESAHQSVVPKGDRSSQSQDLKKSSGSLFQSASSTPMAPPEQDTSLDFTGAGACAFPQEQYEQVSDDDLDRSASASGSGSEDGHFSDVADPPEQTEDMSYRETLRSVRAFMGWHHIPAFKTDFSEPDKSNNPWKGKNPRKPTRISVAMPPDDWLCQKLERLNLTVAEGYPSCSQDSAGLKRDQFIKVPKSQEKWYKMPLLTRPQALPPGLLPKNPCAGGSVPHVKTVISSIMRQASVAVPPNFRRRCHRILLCCPLVLAKESVRRTWLML